MAASFTDDFIVLAFQLAAYFGHKKTALGRRFWLILSNANDPPRKRATSCAGFA
jgi:hypothetical protein